MIEGLRGAGVAPPDAATGAAPPIPRPTTPGPTRVSRRLVVAGGLIAAGTAVLAWSGLQQTMVYYVTVGELRAQGAAATGRPVRVGGRLVDGTMRVDAAAGMLSFEMTDGTGTLPVSYRGIKPDMLGYSAQGAYQDVVAEGRLEADGTLRATQLIVKHGPDFEAAPGQSGPMSRAPSR